MATATAPPTADPVEEEPTGPAPTAPAAATGPLARILTPVEPARTAPPLGSTASMGQPSEDTGSTKTTTKDAAGQNSSREGAVSALVRALATRLARTGTTTKVQRTHDVKETRVGGSTSTATSANKAERHAKNDQQHRSNRDAKKADLDNKASQRQDRTNADTKKADTTDRGTKDTKTSDAKRSGASGGRGKPDSAATPKSAPGTPSAPAKGKDGAAPQGAAGPKPGAAAQPGAVPPAAKPDPKGLNAKTNPAKPTPATPAGPAKQPAGPVPAASQPSAPAPRTQAAREAGYRGGVTAAAVTGQVRAVRDGAVDGWDDRTAADKAEARRMDQARARKATKPDQAPAMKKAPAPTAAPDARPAVDLTKKPNPAPQAKAGTASASEPAKPSSAAAPPNPAAPKPKPTREKPMPAQAAPAATKPAAVPVRVTAVGENTVAFTGAAGESRTMSRGQVRTLKGFERRLAEKATLLAKIEENAKDSHARAELLANRATRLLEDAKAVKGGVALALVLLRLAERVKVLQTKAAEVQGNARRSAEAVKVLSANAQTRHGGIYKAVVESPLTKPAEKEFYQDKQGS